MRRVHMADWSYARKPTWAVVTRRCLARVCLIRRCLARVGV